MSPRFELPYAIADLVSPQPMLAATWATGEWVEEARRFGWSFWLAVPDALGNSRPCQTTTDLVESISRLPPEQFLKRIRAGLFHTDEPARVSAEKHEWLHYIGLDDRTGDESASSFPEADPQDVQTRALAVLRSASAAFAAVWQVLRPQFELSARRVEKLAGLCSFEDLSRKLRLKIDFDGKRINAIRGGYSIAKSDIRTIYLLPSAFNTRRFWTESNGTRPHTLFFPYLDISIGLPHGGDAASEPAGQEYDPWLVCRAIGDPTRGAILRRLSREPQSASSLIAALNLSKATISHHIFQLREAGLIAESRKGRSVVLTLRIDAVERLSTALLAEIGSAAR